MANDKFEHINELREATGAGVMECKRALEATNGDLQQAMSMLRERGAAKMEGRADRVTGAGMIETYLHDGRIGVMAELRAETDFVVRSEPFQQLAKDVVMHIAAMMPETVDELLAQEFVKDPSRTVADLVSDVKTRTGENVVIQRFVRFAA